MLSYDIIYEFSIRNLFRLLWQEYTESDDDDDDDKLPLWAIVLIALACSAVLMMLIAFLLYRYYFSKKCEWNACRYHVMSMSW